MQRCYITIESPEKIQFHYQIAEAGARIVAYLLDLFFQWLVLFLLVLLAIASSLIEWYNVMLENEAGDLTALFYAFIYLMYFFMQWGYFTFFESRWKGQSPGKKIMKIRVITFNGEPLTFSTIVLRNLIRGVDAFPFFYLLGGAVALIDKKTRRLGDLIANTLVIKESYSQLKEPDFYTYIRYKPAEELLLSKKLGEEDLYILRRFLNQKDSLMESKRNEIAQKLADQVRTRLELERTADDPISYLEKIYKAHTYEN